jgi:hypothetical protein
VPSNWESENRLFCWESAPRLRVVGLATILSTNLGEDEAGDRLFSVRYLTRRLPFMPTIGELRAVPVLNTASFLKTGPATTLFPLSNEQAELLFGLLLSRNPEISSVWPDLTVGLWSGPLADVEAQTIVREGAAKLVTHFVRERNRTIVAAKKADAMAKGGTLGCEVCGFDFAATYAELGADYCEVHHRTPLAEARGEVETKLRDLAIVCSNCHRMLHRETPFLTVEQLRARVRARTKRET